MLLVSGPFFVYRNNSSPAVDNLHDYLLTVGTTLSELEVLFCSQR